MAPRAPMFSRRAGPGTRILCATVLGLLITTAQTARSQEEFPEGLPDWILSIGTGASFSSRDVDGLSDGIVQTGNTSAANCDATGLCVMFDQDTRAVDGLSIPLGAQLMGPAWDSAWGKPRLFAHGAYAWSLKDRVVSEVGSTPSDFDTNGLEADVRLRLVGEPEYFWWVGGGVAFQLPVHRYPVWLKLSANYMVEQTNVVGRVDQLVSIDPVTQDDVILKSIEEERLKLHHVAPAIGLEALFARVGPVALGLSGDFMVGFVLNSTDEKFVVEAPGVQSMFDPDAPFNGGPVTFRYDGDSPWFWGGLTIRLTWVGFQD